MDVVFFGSADFGLPALERIIAQGHRVSAVVTTPDRPRGRGLALQPSPVARYAVDAGLGPILKPEGLTSSRFLDDLRGTGAEVFLVIAYRILPVEVFSLPRFGTINLHASLLPRLRGPAPVQRAIERGDTETGVTVFRIDTGVDTGGVLLQRRVPVGPDITTPELYDRLSVAGAGAVSEALAGIAAGSLKPLAQESSLATRAPKLAKGEGVIDWSQSGTAIRNKVRAFKPFPGTWTLLEGRRLGIEWVEPAEGAVGAAPGTVVDSGDGGIVVQCGQGAVRVTEVKPEGRACMAACGFLRGRPVAKGAVLG